MTRSLRLAALTAAVTAFCGLPTTTTAQVVVNEFSYDDSSTDNASFVELFNKGSAPVSIDGWQLGVSSGTITLNAPTSIEPGAYFVIGLTAVPTVAQVVPEPFLTDDMGSIRLANANGDTVDQVVYEANKRTFAIPAGASMVWSNDQSIDVTPAGRVRNSLGRYFNGYQGPLPGSSFGVRPSTPGAANATTFMSTYTPPDVNGLAVNAEVPGMTGSYVNPRVIDPTATGTYNPVAIPAPPGGGKVLTMFDTTGGGNSAVSNAVFPAGGGYQLKAYFNTTALTAGEIETTAYGVLGHPDAVFNTPDPSGKVLPTANGTVTAAGATGLMWLFQRNGTIAASGKAAAATLYLIDANDGGNSNAADADPALRDWSILTSIDLTASASNWYDLSIAVDPSGAGTATFEGQTYTFTTSPNLAGDFYVGYREGISGAPASTNAAAARFSTPRWTAVPEPSALGLLAVGSLAAMRRHRRRPARA